MRCGGVKANVGADDTEVGGTGREVNDDDDEDGKDEVSLCDDRDVTLRGGFW